VVIATAAHTDSDVSERRLPGVHYSHAPDFGLAAAAVTAARATEGARVHAGPVFTSDAFYSNRPHVTQALVEHGTLAVEMEAAGLYAVADVERRKALAIMSISDLTFRADELTAAQREELFDHAVQIALTALATAE
jgi:purine-nucleoside phosphorylase